MIFFKTMMATEGHLGKLQFLVSEQNSPEPYVAYNLGNLSNIGVRIPFLTLLIFYDYIWMMCSRWLPEKR